MDPLMEESSDDSVSSEEAPSNSSTSDPSSSQTVHKTDSLKVSLSHNETKAVNRSKILVYIALVFCAITIGTSTYFIAHQAEVQNFDDAFESYAGDVYIVANSNADKIFGVAQAMSTSLTSHEIQMATLLPDTWPNVTIPNFDIRFTDAFSLTGVAFLASTPLVTGDGLPEWVSYTQANQGWIADDWSHRDASFDAGVVPPAIFYVDANEEIQPINTATEDATDLHYPLWQIGPAPYAAGLIGLDLYQSADFTDKYRDGVEARHAVLSGVVNLTSLLLYLATDNKGMEPHSVIFEPIFSDFTDEANVTGFVLGGLPWEYIFTDVLPTGTNGLIAQVDVSCGESFTYKLDGRVAEYLGMELVGSSFDESYKRTYPFAENMRYRDKGSTDTDYECEYNIHVLATKEFQQTFFTNGPIIFSVAVSSCFLIFALVFFLYDWNVRRRQDKLLHTAERTNAIVSNLFPKDVRERIMADAEEQAGHEYAQKQSRMSGGQLKELLNETAPATSIFKTKPIADLFPEVTVMFADLVGFTAWSSTREPAQVFTLLETIYHEFDQIAKRRRVFKVETVGDCYVAVAGLPEYRKDHATIMARFARDCLYKMHILVRQLEITLGPDTAELGLRFGLHSGPVTAGVLRGERARFQLFGDTMNTTARVETTGAKNKIHISQETADLLIGSGKGHWVRARDDKVHAKGKGELNTYWLEVKGDVAKSQSSNSSGKSNIGDSQVATDISMVDTGTGASSSAPTSMDEKGMRLVQWNTEIIGQILKEIVARRDAIDLASDSEFQLAELEQGSLMRDHTVLEECADVIELPTFCASKKQRNDEPNELPPTVVDQLRDYIQTIAMMYRRNPFHNFEHASHVTMSTTKLLSRIVAPDIQVSGKSDIDDKVLHDHTYGITSSPLTQFAIVLGALIHDVDHTGVPNSQLIEEQASIAAFYKNKSVAEQNSVDIAWDLLMQDSFAGLRRTIYQTKADFARFRQLLVNTVLATDIMDKDLSAKRKERWALAFAESTVGTESKDELTARKATIVIEHLIQASDVVHTMQHWHVYRKWNERLFFELFMAYKEGRSTVDPSENWYKGEIGFFDFYIIPLAKKLKDCGVFGVSSDEYLNYAQNNRREWEIKGQEVVAEMTEKAATKFSHLMCM